jgi:O-antigen/teichoic acid export membrane protein
VQPPTASGETVTRNAAFALGTLLISAAFTAGLTIYLARTLGAHEYGVFALALGVGGLLVLPSDFGISSSAARFIAEHRGDREAAAAVLSDALRLKTFITVPVCVALALLAGPIASAYGTPSLAWPLRGVAIALAGQNVLALYQGAFMALGRTSLQLRVTVAESVVETGATVALVLLGSGAAGAGFGRAIGYTVGAAAAVAVGVRYLGSSSLPRARRAHGRMRQIAGYAGPLLIVDGAFTAFEQVDILLIGGFLSATAVGVFQAPLRLATFLHYPGRSLASAITPRLADGVRNAAEVARFQDTLRYLILVQMAMLAPVVVWAGPMVHVALGGSYAGSEPVLRALAPFVVLNGLAPMVSLAVNYLGEARRRIPIAIFTVVVNVAIDVALIPTIGVVGGAIGTDVAFAIYVPAHLLICRRMIGVELAPLGWAAGRSLVAAAAMAGVLLLFGTSHLSVLDWVAGSVAGAAVYVAALLATRELSLAELRLAWSSIRSRLRRADQAT